MYLTKQNLLKLFNNLHNLKDELIDAIDDTITDEEFEELNGVIDYYAIDDRLETIQNTIDIIDELLERAD